MLMGLWRWRQCQQLLIEDMKLADKEQYYVEDTADDISSSMGEEHWKLAPSFSGDDNSSSNSSPLRLHRKQEDSLQGEEMAGEVRIPSDSGGSDYEDSEDSTMEKISVGVHQYIVPRSLYSNFQKSKFMSTCAAATISTNTACTDMTNNNLATSPHGGSLSSLRISQNASTNTLPNNNWYLSSFKTDSSSSTSKMYLSEDSDTNEEQPLDLSTKSSSVSDSVPARSETLDSPNDLSSAALKIPILNINRHILKAKPRLPMPGRRTYTEEELQAALRDIQSGKLGTRRAAVIYGIPRSTLRNKVYKLAMEKERETGHVFSRIGGDHDKKISDNSGAECEDKEDSGEEKDDEDEDMEKDAPVTEEEKEMEEDAPSTKPPIQCMEDLIRYSKEKAASESLRTLLEHGSKFVNEQNCKQEPTSPTAVPSLPAQFPPPFMFPPGAAEIWGNLDPISIAPYLTQIMAATRENMGISTMLGQPNPYIGMKTTSPIESNAQTISRFGFKFPSPVFPELVHRMMIEERILIEEQRKRELDTRMVAEQTFSRESNKEDTDSCSPSGGQSSSFGTYKNGSSERPGSSNYIEYRNTSEDSEKSVTQSPPPGDSDSSSPPITSNQRINLNLRDVIAKSISHRFQQTQEQNISTGSIEQFRRFPMAGYSSVIKSHSSGSANVNTQSDSQMVNNVPLQSTSSCSSSNSGGKGTRPKRGKYRNYDRDSLVEAVRAVQRGEMSVHRAGSYYGVPHSTLEYKVKERHLMRPRKREPKHPIDADMKKREDGSVLRLASTEKPSTPVSASNSVKKPQFTATSSPNTSNGLKIPTIFDTVNSPFSSANPFPFWPPNPFHQLALDYPRNTASFSSEHLLASHLVQRIQEETSKLAQPPPSTAGLPKNTREVAESLYDGSGINGTFLDGIIRSSLETGLSAAKETDNTTSDHIPKKNILQHMYRSKYVASLSKIGESTTTEDTVKPTNSSSSTEQLNPLKSPYRPHKDPSDEQLLTRPASAGKQHHQIHPHPVSPSSSLNVVVSGKPQEETVKFSTAQ